MGGNWIWLIPVALILSGVATTWIRAKHGYPIASRRGPHGEWHVPSGTPSQADELKEALSTSEAKLANLEERVRVLEKIVTDTSTKLGEEIERLRD